MSKRTSNPAKYNVTFHATQLVMISPTISEKIVISPEILTSPYDLSFLDNERRVHLINSVDFEDTAILVV